MNAVAADKIAIPGPLREHPRLTEHALRRQTVVNDLADARVAVERLAGERAALDTAAARALAGCGGALARDVEARCAVLDGELGVARDRVAALEHDLARLEGEGRTLAAEVRADVARQVASAVQSLLQTIGSHLNEIETCAAALAEIRRQHPGAPVPQVPAFVVADILPKFTLEASRFGVR